MQAEKKILLKKFLDGNCSEGELQEVKVLLNEPEAREFLHELMENQAEQVEMDDMGSGEHLDQKTEEWLRKVHQQMDVKPKKWNFLRYAAIWAGILMVASVAFFQLYKAVDNDGQLAYIEKVNKSGIPVKYMLPDSSLVYLGAGSQLSYPIDFDDELREVKLKGEAFFQVKHMPSKPFIVHTGEVQTRVLGTSFKVHAFDNTPLIVSVATGKVSVSKVGESHRRQLALLTPGLQVTYHAATDKALKGNVDINALIDWKEGDIFFDEERLEYVTNELERRFGVKIIFADESLKDYKVSGSFAAGQSVETDMKILSRIGTFRYHSNNSKSFLIDKQ